MNLSEKRHRPNQRRGQRMHGRRGQRRGWRTLERGQLLDLKHQLERSAGFRGQLDSFRRQTRIFASLGGHLFSRIGNSSDGRRAPGASQPIRADTAEMSTLNSNNVLQPDNLLDNENRRIRAKLLVHVHPESSNNHQYYRQLKVWDSTGPKPLES